MARTRLENWHLQSMLFGKAKVFEYQLTNLEHKEMFDQTTKKRHENGCG